MPYEAIVWQEIAWDAPSSASASASASASKSNTAPSSTYALTSSSGTNNSTRHQRRRRNCCSLNRHNTTTAAIASRVSTPIPPSTRPRPAYIESIDPLTPAPEKDWDEEEAEGQQLEVEAESEQQEHRLCALFRSKSARTCQGTTWRCANGTMRRTSVCRRGARAEIRMGRRLGSVGGG